MANIICFDPSEFREGLPQIIIWQGRRYKFFGYNKFGKACYKLMRVVAAVAGDGDSGTASRDCCLITDQGDKLNADDNKRLCPDQGCKS